jgi:hypothetical protein
MYDPSRPAAGSRVDMCDGEIALAEDVGHVAAGLVCQDIISPRIFSAQERGGGHVTCFFFPDSVTWLTRYCFGSSFLKI